MAWLLPFLVTFLIFLVPTYAVTKVDPDATTDKFLVFVKAQIKEGNSQMDQSGLRVILAQRYCIYLLHSLNFKIAL